jgi:tetratricopeptide (TPR) repeat protein/predicted aspartyl protease
VRGYSVLIPLAWLFASWAHAADGCKLLVVADLPVMMEGLRPVVVAKINDVDVRFVLDSGAYFSALTEAAVVEYKLPTRSAPSGVAAMGIAGGRISTLATVQTFTLGTYPIHDMRFFVGAPYFVNGVVGLFGQNLMLPFDEEFDLAHGEFQLILPKDCKSAPGAYWTSSQPVGVIDVDAPSVGNPTPGGTAYVNGVKVSVKFDTGAPVSILSLAAAKRAGITPKSVGVKSIGATSGVGGGLVKQWLAPLAKFSIGDEIIKNTQVTIADFRSDTLDMLLGDDFFLSHHVYVAKAQRKLLFTYNGGAVFRLEAPATSPQSSAPSPGETAASADQSIDAAALMRRGVAFAARKDFQHALSDLSRACELAPNQPDNFYELARVQWDSGQPDLALKNLDRAIELKPDYVNALFARARLRLKQHIDVGSDLPTLEKQLSPADELRFQLADLYEDTGNYSAAVRQFDVWISARPSDHLVAWALNARCWARATGNLDLDDALTDCNNALQREIGNGGFADSRALVRLRRGEFDRAISDYDYALEREPKNATSLYGRGLAKLRKGLAAAGKSDLDAATAIDPKIAGRFAGWGLKP